MVAKIKNINTGPQQTAVYAVYGLTEWIALISVGQAKVRIPFTGGSLSGYGCIPATFTTASEALKKLIEGSAQFRSGRIKKIKWR